MALVTNIPLIYPVAPLFNNEGETGDCEGENRVSLPLAFPSFSFLAAFPLLRLLFLQRAFTLEGWKLVLSYVSLPGPQPF